MTEAATAAPPGRFVAWLSRVTRRLALWALVALAFLTPFAVSLAANVTAGVRSGSPELLVAGLAIPVMLMIAIELYLWALDRHGDLPLLAKVAMAAPVAVAAGWSWLDTTSLLLNQYHDPWWLQRILCVAAPLSTDGLAVLAVFVRRLVAKPAKVTTAPLVKLVVRPVVVTAPEPVVEVPEQWGPPETVTNESPAPTPEPARPALRSVTSKRTRSELVTAGNALKPQVKRGANEKTEDFRRRVERAERAARRDRQVVTA